MTALQRLTLYREQLIAAQSFEEYRAVHLAWVEMLIERERAEEAKNNAVTRWVATMTPEVEIKIKEGIDNDSR